MQLKQLMERCVSRLKVCLTLDTFAETAVLADRVKHQGLHQACIDFAMLEQNRCAAHHVCVSQSILALCLSLAAGISTLIVGQPLSLDMHLKVARGSNLPCILQAAVLFPPEATSTLRAGLPCFTKQHLHSAAPSMKGCALPER